MGTKRSRGRRRREQTSELTEVEWTIMRVVWERGTCAAGDVQEALQDSRDWAYSTVKTTMDRMFEKGLLKVSAIRNLQLFSPGISEVEAKRREVFRTVKRAFDGALTPTIQFLLEQEEFSDEELKELRRLVDRQRRGKA